jgi:Fe-S-cluster containining protein
LTIKTNLDEISIIAQEKQHENDAFAIYLKHQSSIEIDTLVAELNTVIEPKIDCTQCGNCCKTLMIQVEEEEIKVLTKNLKISTNKFKKKYIEQGGSNRMIMNTIPCHFLSENKCSVYEHRFSSCREFPALHISGFTSRIFTTFMHYDRCPIIFNVIEALKQQSAFFEKDI